MISQDERQTIVNYVIEAVASGARKVKACETIGLNIRTLQRWFDGSTVKADQRPGADRPIPA